MRISDWSSDVCSSDLYETILDTNALDRWLAQIQASDLVALDTETTSIDPMVARLVGMSLSTGPGVACYIPVAHRGPDKIQQLSKEQVLERLRPWLEDPAAKQLLNNAMYDAHEKGQAPWRERVCWKVLMQVVVVALTI